jgi:hypothetical protein
MKDEALRMALEAAYLAGFNASGEGYNGEYPFQDHNAHPEQDAGWVRGRDNKLSAIKQALAAPVQEPVAWKWHQAPVKTSWGHDMAVADLAIDKDNTVSVYCERDQTAKVEAMLAPPAQTAPVQVSPLEFVTMVMEKEHLVGKPLFWAEWPNKEKNT